MRTLARFLGPGPSPRAWGLLLETNIAFLVDRSIPTCVGTTRPWCPPVHMWTGHPHVRGDYGQALLAPYADAGPSPRAWGLRSPEEAARAWRRAIPTCVGTTGRATPVAKERPGPSPRAWGLRPRPRPWRQRCRAIPTCVGTTEVQRGLEGLGSGHPHVRGDYAEGALANAHHLGPSPRAWGLLPPGREKNSRMRAIPTCVGTTSWEEVPVLWVAGHPHVRGDYRQGFSPSGTGFGPSPRAWGLHGRRSWHGRLRRAIPTCVGTTGRVMPAALRNSGPSPRAWGQRRAPPRGLHGDSGHPHVRGDYSWRPARPPQARRAIPTCVGTTRVQSPQGPWRTGHPHVRGDYT